jgi:hypothetical protein
MKGMFRTDDGKKLTGAFVLMSRSWRPWASLEARTCASSAAPT